METDLADLAAKFAAHSEGIFGELSVKLALEIVLNEIAEQACLAMGATGAAIVLERDGEMICCARSGGTAPLLGDRFDPGFGISGECIQTGEVQRCDDAQADPRVDGDASRRLGVRSVMVMPLQRDGGELLGIFEVFSSRPAAFRERDERTLGALAQRVVKNLQLAAEPLPAPPVVEVPLDVVAPDSTASATSPPPFGEPAFQAGLEASSGRDVDLVTWVLGLAVVACAVLLGVLVGQHLSWQRAARNYLAKAASRAARSAQVSERGGSPRTSDVPANSVTAQSSSRLAMPARVTSAGGEEKTATPVPTSASSVRTRAAESAVPEGSLVVFQNGKEIFRLPPSRGEAKSLATGPATGIQRASSVEPVMELAAGAAEDSVVYRVEPDYPEEARRQGIQGAVTLQVHIGRDGSVQEVRVVSGQALLAQAATAAVKQWRFKPQLLDGRPAETQTRITLNFRLPQ
ncbi:MAG: TonB family protein [Candidatus Sulfotelmatobacter sp.]